jgi:hypothetical protein
MKKFGIDCRLKDGSLTERTYLLTLSGTGDPPSYPPSSFHLSSTELFASDLDQLTATESISARNSDSLFSTAISRLKYPFPPLPPDSFQKNQRWSKRRKYRSSRSEATVRSLLPPSPSSVDGSLETNSMSLLRYSAPPDRSRNLRHPVATEPTQKAVPISLRPQVARLDSPSCPFHSFSGSEILRACDNLRPSPSGFG